MGEVRARAHWLFKAGGAGQARLCILECPDGDYWVVGSPTGTYRAGHADRGHWQVVEQEYLSQGYLREAEAKAAGVIPRDWMQEPPDPERDRRRRRAVLGLLLGMAGLTSIGAVVWWVIS